MDLIYACRSHVCNDRHESGNVNVSVKQNPTCNGRQVTYEAAQKTENRKQKTVASKQHVSA